MTDTAYVALAMVQGLGRARMEILLGAFGAPSDVLRASVGRLSALPGIPQAVAQAIHAADPTDGERILQQAEQLGGVVLLPGDDRFPPALREIPHGPTLLFAAGRLDLLHGPAVAIVGSRSHTRYGAEVCRHFAGGLARAGLTVVSGLARGLDAMAHAAALDVGGGTVGVLGNGLGVVYPTSNRGLYDRMLAHGCLLTESPPGGKPQVGSFPRRNRLISGLARVTLVVEASGRSGALITADCALAQGRDVLAIPGPVTSPASAGCNRLIQLGAKPALGLRDVLEEYGVTLPDAPAAHLPTDLSTNERRLLELLAVDEGHVDTLAARLGQPTADTLAALTSLEIRGLVDQAPGKVFRRPSMEKA
jgi:DNA processing protein